MIITVNITYSCHPFMKEYFGAYQYFIRHFGSLLLPEQTGKNIWLQIIILIEAATQKGKIPFLWQFYFCLEFKRF